ncbi:MAG: hypothetical protein DLM70_05245, partial [Chloroflexi bacterium]
MIARDRGSVETKCRGSCTTSITRSIVHTTLFTGIVSLAAVLRFDGLSQRGLLYWDEGKFTLEGLRFLSILQALPHLHTAALAGKTVGTAKPGHALLIGLSYGLLGVHDYVPLLLNSATSLVQLGVLFLLARRLFGVRVALMASAFLAVSGYDIIYARSALSESDANLFFLLGVLIWWITAEQSRTESLVRPRWLFALFCSGTALGMALSVNYRLGVYIVTLLAVDLIISLRRQHVRRTPALKVAWIAGLALIPVTWELLGLFALRRGIVLFRSEVTYRPTSYFAEALYQLHGGKQTVLHFNPLPYLQWYTIRQGWPLALLFLVGLAFAAAERSMRWTVPAALILVPYVVYTFAPFIVPRNLDA